MNIGIDIDNVISDYDNCFIKELLLHDKTLRNNGIINKKATDIFEGMFDWTSEEMGSFYKDNAEKIVSELKVIPNSKKYIDKLKYDGHKIIIITARDIGDYTDPYTLTKNWLSKNHIYYDKLIITGDFNLNKHVKTEKCFENNIDIMIDDSKIVYLDCIENNIPVLLMDAIGNRNINATRVHSWEEIYDKVVIHGK